jgi:two-component system sensor histidine kinase TctE
MNLDAPGRASVGAISLRRYLLAGILVPVAVFLLINTVLLYRGALEAANTAYDRTLLASAKTLAELLEASGSGDAVRLKATVAYSALEAFEADNRSRIFYKVTGFQGETVLGFDDLPAWRGKLPVKGIYAALVDFYDDRYLGDDVRVAVLLQPVAGPGGFGMASIQVAETLELRQTLARQILLDTLWHQAVLIAVIALVVIVVVQRATRPVRALSARLTARPESDLTPIDAPDAPRELRPLIDATNHVMLRLQHLLEHQKRFVRDASHQLRTPLAVLKTQVQSALRGDIEPREALVEINETVDRATQLANQMLALAKVEQLRQQADLQPVDLTATLRAVALDLAPLIAEKELEFDIDTVPATVNAHEWMLGELCRNLLHNAIKNSCTGGTLTVRIVTDARYLALTVSDSGPGISAELATRLFQPFSAGNVRHGSGLGLAICREITAALDGSISLDNRVQQGQPGRVAGLDATVRLPLLQIRVQNNA